MMRSRAFLTGMVALLVAEVLLTQSSAQGFKAVPGFKKNDVQFQTMDDDKSVSLQLKGAAVVANEAAFLGTGTKWITNVGIQVVHDATFGKDKDVDFVSVVGNSFHLDFPNGSKQHGVSLPITFAYFYRGEQATNNATIFVPQPASTRFTKTNEVNSRVPHGDETDAYVLGGTKTRVNNEITSWTANLTGSHEAKAPPFRDMPPPPGAAQPTGLQPVPKSDTIQYNLIKDDPNEVILSLVGLPFILGQNGEKVPQFVLGNKWMIDFTAVVDNQAPNSGKPDIVTLMGHLKHLAMPNGKPPAGETLDFTVQFSSQNPPTVNGKALRDAPVFTVKHDGESDSYRFIGAQSPATAASDLLGWNLAIVGRHLPEPGSLTLMAIGVAVLAYHWRRQGWRARGPEEQD